VICLKRILVKILNDALMGSSGSRGPVTVLGTLDVGSMSSSALMGPVVRALWSALGQGGVPWGGRICVLI
jgi:hypothetical protein